MIPILFEAGTKSFLTNGLGRLKDAISCNVTEERNGTYELSMTYPIKGKHYDLLKIDRIICATPADGKSAQPFRIYKISKPISGQVVVSAEHISYLLSSSIVMPFEASSVTEAMSNIGLNLVGAEGFDFWTDKSTEGSYKVETPTDARSLLGGSSGSILDTYGTGEYEFDGYHVKLYLHRGVDNGVTIRYGKNMSDLTYDSDMSNVYTGIVPFTTNDDEIITLPEKVVKSEHTGDFANPHYKVVDFSNEFDTVEEKNVDNLRTLAEAYVKDNTGWELSDNLTLSFVALWQTEEYKDLAIQRVNLCDTVHVIYTDLGVNVTAKVIKTDYDVLAERYNSIEVGNTTTNLSKTISDAIKDATQDVEDEVNGFPAIWKKAIADATAQITGGLGGYIVLECNADGWPEELLIMDSPDKEKAVNVWRWNQGGLGHSHNGYQGPYDDVAITQDGQIVADYITTGTLTANIIKAGILASFDNPQNYWDLSSGTFVLRDDESNEGITYRDGVLNIDAAVIKTGILKDVNGNIEWNLTTGEMTATNLSITAPNFKLTNDGLVQSGSDSGKHITIKDGVITGYNGKDQQASLEIADGAFNIIGNLQINGEEGVSGSLFSVTNLKTTNHSLVESGSVSGLASATYLTGGSLQGGGVAATTATLSYKNSAGYNAMATVVTGVTYSSPSFNGQSSSITYPTSIALYKATVSGVSFNTVVHRYKYGLMMN